MYLNVYCEIGSLHLAHGDHEMFIPTDSKHHHVFIKINEGGCQVCGGDVSTANAVVEDGGFRLYAIIKGDAALLTFLAPCQGGRFDDLMGDD